MASNQRNLIKMCKELGKLFPTEPLDSYKVVNTSVQHIETLEFIKSGPLSVLNKKHKWKEYHVVLYDKYVLMYQKKSSKKPKKWFTIKDFVRATLSDKTYSIMLVQRDAGNEKSFATTSFPKQKIWMASFQAMIDMYLHDGNIDKKCSDIIMEHLYQVQHNDSANGYSIRKGTKLREAEMRDCCTSLYENVSQDESNLKPANVRQGTKLSEAEMCDGYIYEDVSKYESNLRHANVRQGTKLPEAEMRDFHIYDDVAKGGSNLKSGNVRQGTMDRKELTIQDRQLYEKDGAYYITDLDGPRGHYTPNVNSVSELILVMVSNNIGRGWKLFGTGYLNLKNSDIFRCEEENRTTTEKIHAMLLLWRTRNGNTATKEELVRLLKQGEMMDHEIYDFLENADNKKADYEDTFMDMSTQYIDPYEDVVSPSDKKDTATECESKLLDYTSTIIGTTTGTQETPLSEIPLCPIAAPRRSLSKFPEGTESNSKDTATKSKDYTPIGTTTGRQERPLSEMMSHPIAAPRRQWPLSKFQEGTESNSKESTSYQLTHKSLNAVKFAPTVAKKPLCRNMPMSQ